MVDKSILRLEDLKPGLSLAGLEPSVVATITAVVSISNDSVQLKLGQNELEVSLRQDPQGASEPIELVKAQLWVKYQ